MTPPDTLWIVLDTRGHIVGTYRTPEEAGKAAGWGAHIVGYAHSMDEASYRRGWRDAIAAAAGLCQQKAQKTELEIHEDTPIGLAIQLSAVRDSSAELGYDIAALTPPG